MNDSSSLPPWLQPSWQTLGGALDAGRLGHALLIHGPAGLGKRILAARLTARLMCIAPVDGEACGQCRGCRLLAAPRHEPSSDSDINVSTNHPDLVAVAPASPGTQIRVDEIREIIHRLMLTPSIGNHRAARIDDAEQMNASAANALLKTLEEPPAGAWLILTSSRPARLPATIRSRCMQVEIRPPADALALDWLTDRHAGDAPRRELALRLSGGAPLTALAWLENDALSFADEVLQGISTAGTDALQLAEAWKERAFDAWRWIARWCALALRMRLAPGATVASSPALERIARLPARQLQAHYDRACDGIRLSATPVRQDLLLADSLLEWRKTVRGI